MPFEKARRSPRKANCFGMTPVLRHDRGEGRQAGEGGVGGEDEDHRGHDLNEVEDDAFAEDGAGDLGDDRLVVRRDDVELRSPGR